MAKPKDYSYRMIPCEGCGTKRHPTRHPGKDGRQLCRRCRHLASARNDVPCDRPGCTGALSRKATRYCSLRCYGMELSRNSYAKWNDNGKRERAYRERNAVGLNRTARVQLASKWRRQRRPCHYECGRLADTVDHVIPLVRGGTNYEGNLVPCCKSCNSRKQDKLPIEFRLNRPASSTYMPARYKVREVKELKRVTTHERACIVCGFTFATSGTKRKTCGDPVCSREWTNRTTRDSYRRRVGIPVDPTEPTKYWLRFVA